MQGSQPKTSSKLFHESFCSKLRKRVYKPVFFVYSTTQLVPDLQKPVGKVKSNVPQKKTLVDTKQTKLLFVEQLNKLFEGSNLNLPQQQIKQQNTIFPRRQSQIVRRRYGKLQAQHIQDFEQIMLQDDDNTDLRTLCYNWGQQLVHNTLGKTYFDQHVTAVWMGLSGEAREGNLKMFVTLNPFVQEEGVQQFSWRQSIYDACNLSFNNCDVCIDGIKYYFVLTAGEVCFPAEQCLHPNAILRQNQHDEIVFKRKIFGAKSILEFLADPDEASIRQHCNNLVNLSLDFITAQWIIHRLCDRWGKTTISEYQHVLEEFQLGKSLMLTNIIDSY